MNLLTDRLKALAARNGYANMAGVYPLFHFVWTYRQALKKKPDDEFLLDMLSIYEEGYDLWKKHEAERKAKYAERQAAQKLESEAMHKRRAVEIEAAEREELALDHLAATLVSADEAREPVVKKVVRRAREVVAPKQAKREREERVERKAGEYLPEKTQATMGMDTFQRYLHNTAFGTDDD